MDALSRAVCCLLGICLSPCTPGTVLWLDVEKKRLTFVFTHSNQPSPPAIEKGNIRRGMREISL